jgi:hypothetical protein
MAGRTRRRGRAVRSHKALRGRRRDWPDPVLGREGILRPWIIDSKWCIAAPSYLESAKCLRLGKVSRNTRRPISLVGSCRRGTAPSFAF